MGCQHQLPLLIDRGDNGDVRNLVSSLRGGSFIAPVKRASSYNTLHYILTMYDTISLTRAAEELMLQACERLVSTAPAAPRAKLRQRQDAADVASSFPNTLFQQMHQQCVSKSNMLARHHRDGCPGSGKAAANSDARGVTPIVESMPDESPRICECLCPGPL
jgi:hypothetical protein